MISKQTNKQNNWVHIDWTHSNSRDDDIWLELEIWISSSVSLLLHEYEQAPDWFNIGGSILSHLGFLHSSQAVELYFWSQWFPQPDACLCHLSWWRTSLAISSWMSMQWRVGDKLFEHWLTMICLIPNSKYLRYHTRKMPYPSIILNACRHVIHHQGGYPVYLNFIQDAIECNQHNVWWLHNSRST